MDAENILQELNKIFAEVFDDPEIKITRNTSPNDIGSWNSLNHVVLVDTVEKHFSIKFGLADMLKLESAGDICEGIKGKL